MVAKHYISPYINFYFNYKSKQIQSQQKVGDAMFMNLEKAIDNKKIGKTVIAELLGISYGTILQKLHGDSTLTLDEAFLIYDAYFPEYDFKLLFMRYNKDETA